MKKKKTIEKPVSKRIIDIDRKGKKKRFHSISLSVDP